MKEISCITCVGLRYLLYLLNLTVLCIASFTFMSYCQLFIYFIKCSFISVLISLFLKIFFQILESQDSIIADEQYNDTAILSDYKFPVGQPERKRMCC